MFCREDKILPSVPALLEPLTQQGVIVLNGEEEALNLEQETALSDFVEQGGGLICLGGAVQRYRECEVLSRVLGPLHGFRAPLTEIIAPGASTGHYLPRRPATGCAL